MVALESDQQFQPGDVAPPFDLPGTDGETHSLDEFADNEAVLVVFTCNHCPYAIAKIPVLNDIAADYDDVAVVGISPNDVEAYPEDSLDRMAELTADRTIRYDAYLYDESQAVAKAYGAVCTPDPFLLRNVDGEFVLSYHGRIDDALNPDDEPTVPGGDVREAIDTVLARESVEAGFKPSRGCSIKWKSDSAP